MYRITGIKAACGAAKHPDSYFATIGSPYPCHSFCWKMNKNGDIDVWYSSTGRAAEPVKPHRDQKYNAIYCGGDTMADIRRQLVSVLP